MFTYLVQNSSKHLFEMHGWLIKPAYLKKNLKLLYIILKISFKFYVGLSLLHFSTEFNHLNNSKWA